MSRLAKIRFEQTKKDSVEQNNQTIFGDLVVLLNPAIEAQRFANLFDMSQRDRFDQSPIDNCSSYPKYTRPGLVILTSKHDDATGQAFPAGRWTSTRFETYRKRTHKNCDTTKNFEVNEENSDLNTIGHSGDFITHKIKFDSEDEKCPDSDSKESINLLDQLLKTKTDTSSPLCQINDTYVLPLDLSSEQSAKIIDKSCVANQKYQNYLKTGEWNLNGFELIKTKITRTDNPLFNIAVDDCRLMNGHNEIWGANLRGLISNLIDSVDPAYVESNKEDKSY